ncbi:Transcriptional regulator, TetR family [[Actinomadura] parvosata subsp. kistnae]|uniref:TetR family transcriptional regulator n=1 Tax=[Actinomadura] parvosata subsp. kistnae TaxID=1909395 RepID=A0A1U9ZUA7_9ACTN|nr:TetR/AcrR family transcriptional regulator [Nonomuraea sp. ATCC 55076]AQZ61540.1 TetR family transcriptional regulator [Nonomuraea sp. ATCC 55076]SPL98259.1 Transcriptional regulator, TetR family [Actinomadura parvosata subsp. kistnae]
MTRRTPTGAAVLQPSVTRAITEAVLDEWAEQGYGRLSMEAVAKRAGVGKSALYRRWPSKQEMAMSVISEFTVGSATVPDTGSLRGDVRAILDVLMEWMTHPRFRRILPDLVAEAARNPELADASIAMIGTPRRERARPMFERAIERGELPPDTDVELALDLVAAPIYWRLTVRGVEAGPGYLDALADTLLAALRART